MKALGLSEEDYDNEPPYKVYEDCWVSLSIFIAMSTQWRYASAGMAGMFQTGIDYGVLPTVFDVYSVKQEDRLDVFSDIRVMESTALELFAKQRKQNV